MDARIQLLEVAAFLDRVERGSGEADDRLAHMKKVIPLLLNEGGSRVKDILDALSYDGEEPVTEPVGPRACGVPLAK